MTENEPDTVHDYEDPLCIDSIVDTTISQWSVNLETAGEDICYKIEMGAQVNVIPKKHFVRLKLKSTSVKLSACNDSSMTPVMHKDKKHQVLFIIVISYITQITGLKTSERLNIVRCMFKIIGSHSFDSNQILDELFIVLNRLAI